MKNATTGAKSAPKREEPQCRFVKRVSRNKAVPYNSYALVLGRAK